MAQGPASKRMQKQMSRIEHENRTNIYDQHPLVLSPAPSIFNTETSWGNMVST